MFLRLLASIGAAAVVASMSIATPMQSAAASVPAVVQCYGAPTFANLCGRTPPSPLQQHVPDGVTVVNHAVGSHRSFAIATKMGVYRLTTGQALTIPATGAVEIGTPDDLPVEADRFDVLTMLSTIGGVEGTLRHGHGYRWLFTRTQEGAAKPVPAGTPIVSLEAPRPGAASIINSGMNNITEVNQVLQDIQAMVGAHRAVSDAPYWVTTLSPAWGNSGSVYGIARLRVNAAIRATYGEHVAPFGEYLLNGALADAGIIPTLTDRRRIANGVTPESFQLSTTDWTHHNTAGRQISAQFLASFVSGAMTTERAYARFDASTSVEASARHDTISVAGWAFDGNDVYQKVDVAISVDGEHRATMRAAGPSPDLPQHGVPGSHGFSWTVAATEGDHRVCVIATNFAAGDDSEANCIVVTVDPYAAPGRIAGDDRYETSARIAEHAFTTATQAMAATGRNFADALAAGPVAALRDAPVLLVSGKHEAASATLSALRSLGVQHITVVGGVPSVSEATMASLSEARTSERVAGANRYETAVRLSLAFTEPVGDVYVASGAMFPDALAASAVAGADGIPLLLTPRSCMHAGVVDAIERLQQPSVMLIGGTPTLSAAVAGYQTC